MFENLLKTFKVIVGNYTILGRFTIYVKVRSQKKKKRYYLGIFPKRRPPPPIPPFWEPLIQKRNFSVYFAF